MPKPGASSATTGVAAMNIGYGGEGGGGSYHSVYDSFDHYTRFGDPNFDYGIAQAKTTGRLVLRLANADVLPFELTTFADTVGRYLDELTKLADNERRVGAALRQQPQHALAVMSALSAASAMTILVEL